MVGMTVGGNLGVFRKTAISTAIFLSFIFKVAVRCSVSATTIHADHNVLIRTLF